MVRIHSAIPDFRINASLFALFPLCAEKASFAYLRQSCAFLYGTAHAPTSSLPQSFAMHMQSQYTRLVSHMFRPTQFVLPFALTHYPWSTPYHRWIMLGRLLPHDSYTPMSLHYPSLVPFGSSLIFPLHRSLTPLNFSTLSHRHNHST